MLEDTNSLDGAQICLLQANRNGKRKTDLRRQRLSFIYLFIIFMYKHLNMLNMNTTIETLLLL